MCKIQPTHSHLAFSLLKLPQKHGITATMEYTFIPAQRRRPSRQTLPRRSTTSSISSTPSDGSSSSLPTSSPFDGITADYSTQQQQQQEQQHQDHQDHQEQDHQQHLDVQKLDPAEMAEYFDLRPPLGICGRGQMLMWKNCMMHVYHMYNDTLPGEQVPLGDGKCVVPHGTSVWLAGRTGSVKQRSVVQRPVVS
ncbi:nucleoporin ASM4 [Microdochium nivale]|nr:nucleoporin ASM4 [Microdochium nivale]